MKPLFLYLAALSLNVALLALFTQSHFYRRNPAFWLWLSSSLGLNAALLIFRWAGERSAFDNAQRGADVLYYLLTAAVIVTAVAGRSDVVNQILWRGVVAGLIFAVVARTAGQFGLAGRGSAFAADAINLLFLFPAAWMLLKLAALRMDQHPLIASISNLEFKVQHALGFARGVLG